MTNTSPESIDWLLNRAALAYETEINEAEKIRGRASFILTVGISPCAGIAAYLAKFFWDSHASFDVWLGAILSLLVLSITLLLIAIVDIGHVLCEGSWGYFKRLNFAPKRLRYLAFHCYGPAAGCLKYTKVFPSSVMISHLVGLSSPVNAFENAKLSSLKSYVESAEQNREQNTHWRGKLLLAQRCVFTSFVFITTGGYVWVFQYFKLALN